MTVREAIEHLKDMYNSDKPFMHGRRIEIEVAISALKKQIPKRPRVDDDSWYCCPRCDETFSMWDKLSRRLLYCGNCGQKLDWSKVDAQKRSDTNDR